MAVDVQPDPRTIGENPLIGGLERLPVPATTLTIFGATGDLAHRKLLPALYNLAHEGALPERFNLIGTSRGELTHDEYRKEALKGLDVEEAAVSWCAAGVLAQGHRAFNVRQDPVTLRSAFMAPSMLPICETFAPRCVAIRPAVSIWPSSWPMMSSLMCDVL